LRITINEKSGLIASASGKFKQSIIYSIQKRPITTAPKAAASPISEDTGPTGGAMTSGAGAGLATSG
jgi:hypothetical protein